MPWAKKIKLKFPLPKTFIGFVNIRYSFSFPTLANLSILFFLQYIPPLGRALSHSGGQRGQKNILRFPSKIFNTLLVNGHGHTCEEESSNRGAGETTTTNQRRPHSEVREQNKQKKGQNIECILGQYSLIQQYISGKTNNFQQYCGP